MKIPLLKRIDLAHAFAGVDLEKVWHLLTGEAIKKRILIVTDAWHPQVNGVVRTYEHLCAELVTLGHEVRVIGPDEFPRTRPMPFYPEIRMVMPPYTHLYDTIDSFAPDSLHIATEGPLGWAARRYARRKGLAFSTAYHTQFPSYLAHRIRRKLPMFAALAYEVADSLLRRFHAPAAVVITTTRSINAELRDRGYKMRLGALPRGVPTDLFNPSPRTLFQDLAQPVALYAGRVSAEKNIEAFLAMPWDGSKVVVGDGPALADLQAVYPDAVFTGRKTGADLVACYRSADVFVFPSRTETFGIVIVEALACGLPVAAYRAPGPADIVTRDFLGVLGDDLGAAATCALQLTDRSAERVAWVGTHFSWPVIARHFLKILERAGA